MAEIFNLLLRFLLRLPHQWNLRGIRLQPFAIQLWLVLHFCTGICLSRPHIFTGIQHKTYGESMENLFKTLCCFNGFSWPHKGLLAFLNYPAQLIFKSAKVLPVMVMGAFIPGLRRKYSLNEYISALLLVVGLILFTLADAQTSPNFSLIGVLVVVGALIMDAFLGNLQEAIFTMNPETTQMEMLFCSTVVGLPMLIPPMILTGEMFKAWKSCSEHLYVYAVLVFEAMATFVGQISVLSLIAIYGAATTAMVTTARKAVTLLLSYLIFTKPMTEQHGTGLLLISMGIILKLLPEYREKNIIPQRPKQQIEEEEEEEMLREKEEKNSLV